MQSTTVHSTAALVAASVLSGIVGALATYVITATIQSSSKDRQTPEPNAQQCHRARYLERAQEHREQLPQLIILVRHGESEGNADVTLYRSKPDNLVSITDNGVQQAQEAGRRIEQIFQCQNTPIQRVHLDVSPFERTLQTAKFLRSNFEHRIVRTNIEPRLREQEFGNLQGDNFKEYREEQRKIGRFWYRFPTGESGADVYDRVKSWWNESVQTVNDRVGYEKVDAMVAVTHGLTMRFVLMQLFRWSPTTFHSVWNAENCDVYVLKKELDKPGLFPYVLDGDLGDLPKSSIDLMIEFRRSGAKKQYKLQDYLSIPPPRTTQIEIVKRKLADQYPSMDIEDIENIVFMPFIVDGAHFQGRTTSGVVAREDVRPEDLLPKDDDGNESSRTNMKRARQEVSCRFPDFDYWKSQRFK